MGMGCPCEEQYLGQDPLPVPPSAPPLPGPGTLPLSAQERIRSLCQRQPDLCARLCSKYPLANAFMRSGCATPMQLAGMRGLGQEDAVQTENELRALDTELTQGVMAQEGTAAGYFAQASDIGSGAAAWLSANPMLAIGAAVGLYLLLRSGGKRR